MYEIQPKKLMIINILDILKKYSDEDHRLTQKDIIELLKRDYNMTVDRKSVKSNLMNLIEAGYHINYSESLRKDKNGEEHDRAECVYIQLMHGLDECSDED